MHRSFGWILAAVTFVLAAIFFALFFRPQAAEHLRKVSPPPSPVVPSPPPVFEPDLPEISRGSSGAVRISLILDDFGSSWRNVDSCLALPNLIAIAVIPHLRDSARVAEAAKSRGFDVFLHQPMEPHNFPKENPGKYGIYLWQTKEEVAEILRGNLSSLGVTLTGVNNHTGSRATEERRLMEFFFDAFPRQLIFLDSRTSSNSVAYDVARSRGIRALKNNVFIDASFDRPSIEKSFDQLLRQARRDGSAIGIGHVQSHETIKMLEERLPALSVSGVSLVRLGELVPETARP